MVALAKQNDLILHKYCKSCAGHFVLFVNRKDYLDWIIGKGFIQDLMPYLSASERELLISSTCGPCFEKMFECY